MCLYLFDLITFDDNIRVPNSVYYHMWTNFTDYKNLKIAAYPVVQLYENSTPISIL